MTTPTSTNSATAGISTVTAKLPRHLVLMMDFNIIVTFHISRKTEAALASVTDQNLLLYGSQIIFCYRISIRPTSSYDSLMRRLRKAVLSKVNTICGLGETDVAKISTAGNWKLWEHVTGLCEASEAARSKVANDGKFYF